MAHVAHVAPDKSVPTLIDIRTKEERLPESSEVVIDPRGHHVCRHVSGYRKQFFLPRDSLTSHVSSVYLNDKFQDGVPCQAKGCPLNPATRVRVARRLESK